MKNLVTSLALAITLLGFSQSKSINEGATDELSKLEDISVTVTADSAADIESTFKIEDIEEILESADTNERLSFKIICNGKTMSNGVKSHISYSVEGNSNNSEEFLRSVEKIKASAINYYKNKK